MIGRCCTDENDISAEKASESQGARLQKKNGYKIRQKDFIFKKTEGQKIVDCVKCISVGRLAYKPPYFLSDGVRL